MHETLDELPNFIHGFNNEETIIPITDYPLIKPFNSYIYMDECYKIESRDEKLFKPIYDGNDKKKEKLEIFKIYQYKFRMNSLSFSFD